MAMLVGSLSLAQEVWPLYAGIGPYGLDVPDTESSAAATTGNRRTYVTQVTRPTITVFLPKSNAKLRTAVLICPGGGYSRLSIEDGGYEAAKDLAEQGIVGIVLKYRTQREGAYTNYQQVPLTDLQTAMQLVYTKASTWNIDTTRIGILGFSAGGHLTALAVSRATQHKPAFTILAYPVISFQDSLTSPTSNSRANLLGKQISESDKRAYSPELHVNAQTPPSFLLHAKDDQTSWVGNSIVYHRKLQEHQVPTELLLFERGGHGFAMYNKMENIHWLPKALDWMKKQGFYKP
jgi:acetyl esterase/lipase